MSLIAIVTQDLFLTAKIEALVRQEGFQARRVLPQALALLDEHPAALVLDLGLSAEARMGVVAWASDRMPVVAFGAHVDRDALAWARQADLHAVLTKGQLEARLGRAIRAAVDGTGA